MTLLLLLTALLCVRTYGQQPEPSTNPQKIDPAKFEGLYRAAKAVEGATATGVTYPRFVELMQTFAAEASIARDLQVSDREREVLVFFVATLTAYNDSATIWRKKIESTDDTFKGQIVYAVRGTIDPQLEPIVKRYGISIQQLRLDSREIVQTISPDSVQVPWNAAQQALSKAVALYMPASNTNSLGSDASRLLDELVGKKPSPTEAANATVWLYRTKSATDSMLNPTIYSRGEALAKLEKGQYFALQVPPGTYFFSWSETAKSKEEAWITVAAAGRAFLKVRYREIKPVTDPKDISKDFGSLHPIDRENIISPKIIATPPF